MFLSRIMRYLPRENLAIESDLTREELAAALRTATAEPRWLQRPPTDKLFVGRVGDRDFRVVRAITYGNSFLPVIRGRVEDAAQGSRLAATLRLHPLVAGFATLWLGLLGFITLIAIGAMVTGTGKASWIVLGPIALLVVGGGFLVTSFATEAKRAQALLESIATSGPSPELGEDWFEASDNFGLRDVRRAGALGYLALLLYPVAVVLAFYDWFRIPGCTHDEEREPTIYCPAGWRSLSVWAGFAAIIVLIVAGTAAMRRGRMPALALVVLWAVAVVAFLAWVARDPAFYPHVR